MVIPVSFSSYFPREDNFWKLTVDSPNTHPLKSFLKLGTLLKERKAHSMSNSKLLPAKYEYFFVYFEMQCRIISLEEASP